MIVRRKQRGAVLIMSLILLLMMTTFVISSVNVANLSLKIVGNMQVEQNLEAVAQRTVEETLSLSANFDPPSDPPETTVEGYVLNAHRPDCIHSMTAEGYSATFALAPDDNLWEVVVDAEDSTTGAVITIHQGVLIRQLQGRCL